MFYKCYFESEISIYKYVKIMYQTWCYGKFITISIYIVIIISFVYTEPLLTVIAGSLILDLNLTCSILKLLIPWLSPAVKQILLRHQLDFLNCVFLMLRPHAWWSTFLHRCFPLHWMTSLLHTDVRRVWGDFSRLWQLEICEEGNTVGVIVL